MLITGFDNQKPRPTHTGGNADVFEGVHNGRRVAIKVVRVCTNDLDEYARVGPFAYANYGIQL